MSDKNNTKVITRAAKKGRRGAVRQHSKRRPVVYTGPSIFDDLDADRRAALYDEITALPAQSFLTGTGRELFAAFGPRARYLSIHRDGASVATEE